MKVMLMVLLMSSIVFSCPGGPEGANCRAKISPLMESAKFEQDIKSGKLAERSEAAIDMLIKIGAAELKKRGYLLEAASMHAEWNSEFRYEFRKFAGVNGRPIGDHKPISQWLKDKYDMMEMILGVQVCKATHLSDLKTLNHAIPVVFRPCSFEMDGVNLPRKDEYRNHFSYDDIYYGLVPVVGYWGVYIAVTAGSAGTGFAFFSGLIASIAEKAISLVTPGLSDFVFEKACNY